MIYIRKILLKFSMILLLFLLSFSSSSKESQINTSGGYGLSDNDAVA